MTQRREETSESRAGIPGPASSSPGCSTGQATQRCKRTGGVGLTAVLAGRGAGLAAVRAQEVTSRLQVLEVSEGNQDARHGDTGSADTGATQPGNAHRLPSGAPLRTAHARRGVAVGRAGGALQCVVGAWGWCLCCRCSWRGVAPCASVCCPSGRRLYGDLGWRYHFITEA